jgi:hypothetical protein
MNQWFFFKRFFVCCQTSNHPGRFSQIWLLTRYEIQNINHPSTSLASHSKPNFFFSAISTFFPSLLAIENLQNHLFSIFPNFYFVFWRNFANKKKAGMNYDHGQKKETLHRSFKSANKLVELGLKWKNKPEDL